MGSRLYPTECRIEQIGVEDIAHGLAYQCQFNGQTKQSYSVAQHSLMVASLVPTAYQRAALMLDAAEAYLGNMVKPLKALLPGFSEIKEKVAQLIADQFQFDFSDYAPSKPPIWWPWPLKKRFNAPFAGTMELPAGL